MKAMIFAAGLGTRLRPLTNNKPKALVEVNGLTLLEINIRRLIKYGFNEIIVNVHYFAEQIEDFLQKKDNFGIRIEISDERELLLETGGGLQHAAWFFDDGKPFLVYNVDILSNIDLHQLYQAQLANPDALATLAVRNRETSRYLAFSDDNYLCAWINKKTNTTRWGRLHDGIVHPYAFSGIHVIDPKIFPYMEKHERKAVYSITFCYLEAAKHYQICCYKDNDSIWLDVGKPEQLAKAKDIITQIDF